tara:strand:+ start:477 stop:659 length:183 start_codon:yes stop_codon:yes gene_type:complete
MLVVVEVVQIFQLQLLVKVEMVVVEMVIKILQAQEPQVQLTLVVVQVVVEILDQLVLSQV